MGSSDRPSSTIVDNVLGPISFLLEAHLSGYGVRRLLSRHPVTANNPAALGSETGIDHHNCIDFFAPSRLVEQGNLDQNQR